MQPLDISLPNMAHQEPMLNLKMDYEKLKYNIRKWEMVKKNLKENQRLDWFNRLRVKLGLPEVQPWLLEINTIRKAYADRTLPYVDEIIQVLKERISETEKDFQEQSLGIQTEKVDKEQSHGVQTEKDVQDQSHGIQTEQIVKDEYVEVLQPQIQADIDNEVEEQFVKITQDEILQILEEQNIEWDEYEKVPEILESILGQWQFLGQEHFDILSK